MKLVRHNDDDIEVKDGDMVNPNQVKGDEGNIVTEDVELKLLGTDGKYVIVSVNGNTYRYEAPASMSATEFEDKIKSIMKYSHGKALAWLKNNAKLYGKEAKVRARIREGLTQDRDLKWYQDALKNAIDMEDFEEADWIKAKIKDLKKNPPAKKESIVSKLREKGVGPIIRNILVEDKTYKVVFGRRGHSEQVVLRVKGIDESDATNNAFTKFRFEVDPANLKGNPLDYRLERIDLVEESTIEDKLAALKARRDPEGKEDFDGMIDAKMKAMGLTESVLVKESSIPHGLMILCRNRSDARKVYEMLNNSSISSKLSTDTVLTDSIDLGPNKEKIRKLAYKIENYYKVNTESVFNEDDIKSLINDLRSRKIMDGTDSNHLQRIIDVVDKFGVSDLDPEEVEAVRALHKFYCESSCANDDQLEEGDKVIIIGNVSDKGKTGIITGFGQNKYCVIVRIDGQNRSYNTCDVAIAYHAIDGDYRESTNRLMIHCASESERNKILQMLRDDGLSVDVHDDRNLIVNGTDLGKHEDEVHRLADVSFMESGERFKALSKAVGSDSLAAWIGRKKYGKKKFSKMAHHKESRSSYTIHCMSPYGQKETFKVAAENELDAKKNFMDQNPDYDGNIDKVVLDESIEFSIGDRIGNKNGDFIGMVIGVKDDDIIVQKGIFNTGTRQMLSKKDVVKLEESAPETLYISRKLLNADKFIEWAKSQGFDKVVEADELHVTIAFSRTPVEWDKMKESTSTDILMINAGKRTVEPLGDKGAVVLKFESAALSERWQRLIDDGCSWDWPGYTPHVTITYEGSDVDLSKVTPYEGELMFGQELFDNVDEDWTSKIKHESISPKARAKDLVAKALFEDESNGKMTYEVVLHNSGGSEGEKDELTFTIRAIDSTTASKEALEKAKAYAGSWSVASSSQKSE